MLSKAAHRVLLLIAAVCLTSCVPEPEPRLRIGTFPRPGFEPFLLARSLGCYDDQRLQFVEFPSAAEMLMAYRNRALDAATVTTDDVLRLVSNGEQFRIVLVLDYSQGADCVLAKPAVPDLASLKGRAVAVESNALGGYVLARALESAGLSSADISIISSRSDRMDRDLATGIADAVVTYEPYRTRILNRGTLSVFDSQQMQPWEISGVLIVPTRLAERPPTALRELATGWFQALNYLAQKPDDAAQRIASREGLTPKQFQKALRSLKFATRKDNAYQLSAPYAAFSERMRDMALFMKKAGMLEVEVNATQLRSDVLFKTDQ